MASAPKDGTVAASSGDKTAKRNDYITDDHVLDFMSLATKYETHIDTDAPKKSRGLTKVEAAARLLKYGPNALTPAKVMPQWLKLIYTLINPLLLMLYACGVLSIIAYFLDTAVEINLWLGIILIVVALSTGFMAWHSVRDFLIR